MSLLTYITSVSIEPRVEAHARSPGTLRLRQEDDKFKPGSGNLTRPGLKIEKNF